MQDKTCYLAWSEHFWYAMLVRSGARRGMTTSDGIVAQAHIDLPQGRIQFFLRRDGRSFSWYDVPAEVTTSKRAAYEALRSYAAEAYPHYLVTFDR